ncbi:MAG: hypothetical protein WA825_14875 [Steroidobacteraceae bacterium]
MNSAAHGSPYRGEFDKFLFSLVGEDRNGLPLSVISLLARMDLDPWQEAGTLADLSAEAAARRLTFSLDTLTDPVLRQVICESMVQRLLALLPRRAPAAAQKPAVSVDAVAAHDPAARIQVLFLIASTIVLIVGMQILVAHRTAAKRPDLVPGPAVLAAPAQTPPTPSGQ